MPVVEATMEQAVVSARLTMLQQLIDSGTQVDDGQLGGTFDALARQAAEQPDNTEVLGELKSLFDIAYREGYVDAAMQMAMALGAMVCTHAHLQDIADQPGKHLGKDKDGHDEHGHDDEDDAEECVRCEKGTCKKHHK